MILNKNGEITHLSILVLGSPCIGKTSLIQKFLNPSMPLQKEYTPTTRRSQTFQHIKYSKSKTTLDGPQETRIQAQRYIMHLIDIGPGEQQSALQDVLKYADAFILCYSVIDRKSFESIQDYYRLLIHHKFPNINGPLPLLLIGTQVDLARSKEGVSNRQVEFAAGKQLAQLLEIPFLETTAYAQTSVNACFNEIIKHTQKLAEIDAHSNSTDLLRLSSSVSLKKRGSVLKKMKSLAMFKRGSLDKDDSWSQASDSGSRFTSRNSSMLSVFSLELDSAGSENLRTNNPKIIKPITSSFPRPNSLRYMRDEFVKSEIGPDYVDPYYSSLQVEIENNSCLVQENISGPSSTDISNLIVESGANAFGIDDHGLTIEYFDSISSEEEDFIERFDQSFKFVSKYTSNIANPSKPVEDIQKRIHLEKFISGCASTLIEPTKLKRRMSF